MECGCSHGVFLRKVSRGRPNHKRRRATIGNGSPPGDNALSQPAAPAVRLPSACAHRPTRRSSMFRLIAIGGALSLCVATAIAADLTVPMNLVDASGKATPAGTVRVTETAYGLVFTPSLTQLPPGLHGFHVHENAS